MNFNDALKVLEQNQANSIYDVYIPSLKKNFPFRFITVAEQMTISKLSLTDKQSKFYEGLLALINTLYVGKDFETDIGSSNITEFDKIAILISIKLNSTSIPIQYSIKCNNGKCKESFNHTVDLTKIVENISKIDLTPADIECESMGTKYKFILSWPSVEKMCKLYNYADSIDDENNKIIYGIYGQLLTYVDKIYINDNLIDDFDKIDIKEKMNMFKYVSDDLFAESRKDSIIRVLSEKFNAALNKLYTVTCPVCKHKMHQFIDPENFFLKS